MPSIYFGQNSPFDIVSRSHGRLSLGYAESFEVDASQTNKRLYFFNRKEALAISIFDGVSGRFGFLDTEEKYYVAALLDVSPSATIINDDPGAYNAFNLILNIKNEQGIIENGIFVKGCRLAGAPETLSPRDEQHITPSYIGATRYKCKGGAIGYTRFVGSAPAYHTADDVAISGTGPHSGTLAETAVSVNITNSTTTRTYLAVFKDGNDITNDAQQMVGFSVSGTQAIFPSGAFTATTSVWEVYTTYIDS